jgi:hypothetical protein
MTLRSVILSEAKTYVSEFATHAAKKWALHSDFGWRSGSPLR